MPLRKGPPPRPLLIVGTALAAAAFAPAGAQAASLAQNIQCTAQVLTSPFAKWGDNASYWLAPGGDFETTLKGWSLSNAKVVSGNETLGVKAGSKSLQLGGGIGTAEATTPEFCVDPLHPQFRFVVKNASASSLVTTRINFRTALGVTLTVTAKLNSVAAGSWQLSSSQPLSTAIPSVFLGIGTTASITFKTTAVGGTVNIDNLMIDPYRRG